MPNTPPALVRVGTRHGLPLLTWHERWHDALAGVAALDPAELDSVAYPHAATEDGVVHVPYRLDRLPGEAADALGRLAAALRQQPAPDGGAALLTGMTDHLGDAARTCVAALAAALRQATGDPTAAVNIPIRAASSTDDGYLDLHADLWRTRLLLNLISTPAPPGDGDALLMPQQTFLDLVGDHLPLAARQMLTDALAFRLSGRGVFDATIVELWTSPDADALRQVVRDASLRLPLGAGEGYLLVDGQWVHGRTWLQPESMRWDRLLRISYDNVDTDRQRPALVDVRDRTGA